MGTKEPSKGQKKDNKKEIKKKEVLMKSIKDLTEEVHTHLKKLIIIWPELDQDERSERSKSVLEKMLPLHDELLSGFSIEKAHQDVFTKLVVRLIDETVLSILDIPGTRSKGDVTDIRAISIISNRAMEVGETLQVISKEEPYPELDFEKITVSSAIIGAIVRLGCGRNDCQPGASAPATTMPT